MPKGNMLIGLVIVGAAVAAFAVLAARKDKDRNTRLATLSYTRGALDLAARQPSPAVTSSMLLLSDDDGSSGDWRAGDINLAITPPNRGALALTSTGV